MEKIDWVHIGTVIIMGALGGLVSYFYSMFFGSVPEFAFYVVVPAYMAFGLVAAFIGVGAVSIFDKKNVGHVVVLALVFGFAWRPVLDASIAFVNQKARQRLGQRIDEVENVASRLSQAPEEELPGLVVELSGTTVAALEQSSKLGDPQYRSSTIASAEKAVSALQKVATKTPDQVTTALTRVAMTAMAQDDNELAYQAVKGLADLSVQNISEDSTPQVYVSLTEVSEAALAADNSKLAFDTRLLRAQYLLELASLSIEHNFETGYTLRQLESAKKDLIDAKDFYESIHEEEKIKYIEFLMLKLSALTKKVKRSKNTLEYDLFQKRLKDR